MTSDFAIMQGIFNDGDADAEQDTQRWVRFAVAIQVWDLNQP